MKVIQLNIINRSSFLFLVSVSRFIGKSIFTHSINYLSYEPSLPPPPPPSPSPDYMFQIQYSVKRFKPTLLHMSISTISFQT